MHPLLALARRTPIDERAARPTGATYDFVSGLWNGKAGPLIDNPDELPTSKKFDVETGEDQKGQ
ncbi:hypothetical protein LB526_08080 [Mesorhizobium sp. CA6]|uniref:hypothetical protein n=1 Tax=Mesorhizobium sp. CA6 TaxID=588500 RepID=UPI001CCBF08E|nr:hypothetical protein [Mesorhizobium sp. CA6]MBZ9766715.1 hypothetical protein [Mesorhizobium sp. CA6]